MYFSGECARVYVMCTFDVSQHHSCRTIHLWMTVVAVPTVSHVRLFGTPWAAAGQAFLSFIISQSLLKLMSTESVMPSNHFILCCPLHRLPSISPSIRLFSSESALWIRWPKLQLQLQSLELKLGAEASASVLPTNTQGLFPLGLTGLISSRSKGLSRVFSGTTVWKYQFFSTLPSLWFNSHIHTWLWENHSFNYTNLTYQENWIDHFVSEQTKCLPRLDRLLVSLLRSKTLLLNLSLCTVSSIETFPNLTICKM